MIGLHILMFPILIVDFFYSLFHESSYFILWICVIDKETSPWSGNLSFNYNEFKCVYS